MNLDTLVHSWQVKFKTCAEAKRVIRFAYKDDRSDLLRAYLDDDTLDHSELDEARKEWMTATSEYFVNIAFTKLQTVFNKYADHMEVMLIKCICEQIKKEQKND